MPYALLSRWLRGLLGKRVSVPEAWCQSELARLVPELGSAPSSRLEPLRLQQALSQTLACWHKVGLGALVLDDLQWADEASVECVMAWLAEPSPALPWVLFTARAVEAVPHKLLQWAEQSPDRVSLQQLGPLDDASVLELVQSLRLPGLDDAAARATATRLMRSTGGRPLFILELLRGGAPQVSASERWGLHAAGVAQTHDLLGMIGSRLSTLSPPALRLIRVAALAGASYSLSLAARVLEQHPLDLADAVLELQCAQLLGEAGVAFDLAQEAVELALPRSISQWLHAAIATALRSMGEGSPAELAQHWEAAGRWPDAAESFEQAAAIALASSRRVDELRLLDLAAANFERSGCADRRFDVMCKAVYAAILNEVPDAIDARLNDLLSACVDDRQRLRTHMAQARFALIQNSGQALLEPANRAFALARSLGDEHIAFQAAVWEGLARALLGDVAGGLAQVLTLKDDLQRHEDPRIILHYKSALGYALYLASRFEEAQAVLGEGVALAEGLGDLAEAMDQLSSQVYALQLLGRSTEASSALRRVEACWLRMGKPGGVNCATMLTYVAMDHYGAGRHQAAIELLLWCLDQIRKGDSPQWQVLTENRIATLYIRLGQWTRARQVMTALPESTTEDHCLARQRLLAQIDAFNGRNVLPDLQRLKAEMTDGVHSSGRFGLDMHIASLSAPEVALDICDRVQAGLQSEQKPFLVSVGAWRAQALRLLGRLNEAAAQAAAVLPLTQTCNAFDLDPAAFWWMVFRALQSAGHADAQVAFKRGDDWIDKLFAHVPESFKPSLASQNPAVRDWLQWRNQVHRADLPAGN